MVGTVLAAGEASGVTEGSTVLSHTRHQSVARFDHRERLCVPLPAGLGVDVAPLARLAQVGGVSLQLAAARPGDSVAVIGLGPVGNLVAQLAHVSGYRVVGVERSARRRALAQACGLKRSSRPKTLAKPSERLGPGSSWSAQVAPQRLCWPRRYAAATAR